MILRTILFIGLVLLGAMPAPAQQSGAPPPQEPVLRIDPGMHTAPIVRIGADAACKLLATASSDKTVRLWRLPEGRLLTTLRPPIGPDPNGQVAAVAVAPDATWVAVAPFYPSQQAGFVYIFQTATGATLARLGPLNVGGVLNLVTSQDGRLLAAVGIEGGVYGLRVWERAGGDLTAWRPVVNETDRSAQAAMAVAFDKSGAIYTVATDGKLRRYAPGGHGKLISAVTRGGKLPYSVAVAPSGKVVAVGYNDTAAVDVYDARTLAWRFSADTKGVVDGNLAAVAWSADGKRLYAGGTHAGDKRILVWDKAGKGLPRGFDGPQNSISHLLACGDGMAMGAFDPAFGILAADGRRRLWQENVQADFRNLRTEDFSASPDGRRVLFALGDKGKSAVLFDLLAEQLTGASEHTSNLATADTTSLPITDWLHNTQPKLRGQPIEMDQYDTSRSLAIAPDKQHFILGTDIQLRAYGSGGRLVWRKILGSTVRGVNVIRDGKLVVAAYGDGTIRWHRLSDGEELLALFVHAKDQRWVAWTPKGYYMASPGAESLIGWHVNRGWDEAAQFFPAARFREQFNRPDIVKLVLETFDEGTAIEEANKQANLKPAVEDVRSLAPPMVVIQKPGDNTTFRTQEVTLEYDVFSPTSQKITKVDYLINNAALGARFPVSFPAAAGKFTFSGRVTLPLPPEDVTITLVAYEGAKSSEPASVRLRWDGAKPGQIALPRLRALFVGVNDYASANVGKLRFAAKDATDLAAFFKGQEGKSYSKVEIKALPDAKRIDVINGLEWLEKESAEGDVNLLFLAGHGATIEQQFYFLAVDSEPEAMRATAVSKDEILRTIRNRKGAMVVMLDACHSGAGIEAPTETSRVDMNRIANELGDQSLGVLLYASARGRQFSFEHADWQNGAFTRAMLEGLAGAADRDKIGYVDTEELSVYVRRRVLQMTKDRQEPVRVKPDAAPEMKIVLLK